MRERAAIADGDFLPSWSSRALGDVAVKIQDGTHFSPALGGTEHKYVTSRNIGPGYLRLDAVETISAEEHREIYRRCDVRFGDLLLTKDGANTGNAALSTFHEEVSLLSSVAFIRTNHQSALEPYVMQYLLSQPGRKQMEDAMAGNAITRLTLGKIKALVVPFPPVEEQRQIATALNAVDEQVAALKVVLAKKEAIQQGLMQQLLTGKTRLPGSSGGWATVRLEEISSIRKGVQKGRRELARTGKFPVWNGGVAPSGYTDAYNSVGNCVTVSEGGNSCGYVGYMSEPFWLGGHCYELRPIAHVAEPAYLYYSLKQRESRLMSLRVGSGLPNIQRSRLAEFALDIALEHDEQRAIARVLTDAEDELNHLCARLAKARALKHGMMQELLTGRTRLPGLEVAA